jgi:hypothetical protein
MKSLQKILAENMLRFGTKNINESTAQNIQRKLLFEDTGSQGQSAASRMQDLQTQIKKAEMDRAQSATNTSMANMSAIDDIQTKIVQKERWDEWRRDAERSGVVVFGKQTKTIDTPLETMKVDAKFYNNMVSIDKGLMSPSTKGNLEQEVNKIVATIQNSLSDSDSIKIKITGTATSAAPKMSGYYSNYTPMPLDHPGTPYDGIDVTKPENYYAGNEYLAKQRANSIMEFLKTKLEEAGITNVTYQTSSKVLQGGFNSDDLRFINVDITGKQTTKEIVTKADIYLEFKVAYETSEGMIAPQAIGAMNAQLGGSSNTGIGYTSDDTPNKAYSCDINITYGQTEPLGFEGTFGAKDEAGTHGDSTSYPGANFIYDINGMTPMVGDSPQGLRGFAINDYYNNPQLDVFLRSCGRYTEEQVKKIMDDIYTANSDLVQKLAAKGTGTFEDFVTISGGSATIDTTKVTIVDYSTNPPTVLPRAK